jgi:nucleoside-diphosphate-sugar epimerase
MKKKQTILITGASGNVGKKLRAHLEGRYELRLLDNDTAGDSKIVGMDLGTWDEGLIDILSGVDVLVHLAADPSDAKPWEELISSNLDALSNVFAAAVITRVSRVVFASSNHVMGGYSGRSDAGRWLSTKLDHLPGTLYDWPGFGVCDSTPYGAMKLCGERLTRAYAQCANAVGIAVRLGWINKIRENRPEDLPANASRWFKQMWLSTDDLCQLMEQAIVVPKEPKTFIVVNGMSDNEGMVWDIEETKQLLGWVPKDGLKSASF